MRDSWFMLSVIAAVVAWFWIGDPPRDVAKFLAPFIETTDRRLDEGKTPSEMTDQELLDAIARPAPKPNP
jgi:hypothetical protein